MRTYTHWVLVVLIISCVRPAAAQMRQIHFEPGGAPYPIPIKRLSFYSPSQGFIASGDTNPWIGFTSDSGRTLVKRNITSANVNDNGYIVPFPFLISGVKAFNQDTVLTYGNFGFTPAILRSVDGGLTHTVVFYSSPGAVSDIFDMIFPENNSVGFAVDGYRILRTTNKGISWSVINSDPNSLFGGLDAIDNSNVFAFSNNRSTLNYSGGKLVKTSNAGITWQNISLPYPGIASVDFYTTNNGWLNVIDNSQSFRVYYTNNGGNSWVLKNDPDASPQNPFTFSEMGFVNDSTGFGIGGLYETYKTTDTGKVWEPISRNINYINQGYTHEDLVLLNNSQLWAGGWDKLIEINTNLSAPPLPKAYFKIDTTNAYLTNIVSLKNYSKPTYQYKWYVNNVLTSTSYNATYTHNNTSTLDSIVLIVTSGVISDTLKRYQNFIIPNLPNIYSFTPTTGSTGTEVIIKGINFTGVTGVSFGGVAAQTFTISSDTVIRAIVAAGATGNVVVSKPGGSFSKPGFIYFLPPSSPPPAISSFSPTSGLIGTVVTINGTNFSANPANNVVYFGDTRATVSSSNSSQIVCTVPVGASYEPISVLNKTTSLSGRSLKPFNVTFADSSNFTWNSFVSVLEYQQSPITSPYRVNCKDLDEDGKPDMILGLFYNSVQADTITIFRNTSAGNSFSFAPPLKIVSRERDLETGDLDGDGLSDFIYCANINNPNTNTVVYIRKNKSVPGQIQFDTAYAVFPQTEVEDIELSDIDGDGRSEIIGATMNATQSFIVARNTSVPGFLSFSSFTSFSTGANTKNISAGDIDGDSKPDVVTYCEGSSTNYISFFRNTSTPGNISFATRVDISPTVSFGGLLSLSDFDGDNKLDIILITSGVIRVYFNTSTPGNISFNLQTVPVSGGSGTYGNISNLSGDAKPDLLGGRGGVNRGLFIKKNTSVTGSTNMDPEVYPNTPVSQSFIYHSTTSDLNLDGKTDIISAGYDANKFVIYENRVGVPIVQTRCAGGQLQIFSGLGGTVFQWQQDAGSGFVNISDNSTFSGTNSIALTINNIPLGFNGNKYRCIVDGYNGTTFILQINSQVVPSVTISATSSSICSGTPVTFTATPANGGTTPSYQWQVNGINVGTNSPTYTTNILANNSQVKVLLTSSNPCATTTQVTSNIITMTVTGSAPSVTITASSTPVCPNTAVTFTATPVNGGPSPNYQWQVNGINAGTNSSTFTTASLASGSIVNVIMSFATSCSTVATATSNIITINNPVTPSVNITGISNICAGTLASFSASTTNGGTSPSYQWQVNGINVGTNSPSFSTSSLSDGAQVKVIMTSNAACATPSTVASNIIVVTVVPQVTPVVTISGNTTVNAGQQTTLSAVFSNGGNSPLLIWQDSTNAHTWQSYAQGLPLTINYTPPHTGAKMRCELQSNAQCRTASIVYSNILTFTVNFPTAINPVPGISFGIKYYPNPANSILYIDSLKLSDKWQSLEVISSDGRQIITGINLSGLVRIQIGLEKFTAGEYIAILTRKSGVKAYLKFIKL